MSRFRPPPLLRRLACALLLAGAAAPAAAQFGLPSMPSLPALPPLPPPASADPLRPPGSALAQAAAPLAARRAALEELLRREPLRLERDPAGEPIVRGELLLHAPPQALLDAARAAGFALLRDETLPGLGLRLVTLQAPPGLDTAAARELLRRLGPGAEADFNHLYLPSGGPADAAAVHAPPAPSGAAPPPGAPRIGLVDSGVQHRHPALRDARLQRHGCGGRAVPDGHGTAVASLLLRAAGAQAALYAADIYCGDPAGGSVERVVQALDWLARERVPVVNLSLVGPANGLLEQAVRRMAARGHLLVAAVGNDGPAAAPLYPAAYAGAVVGVTGVDRRRRVLPEALRGAQVMFAAQGAALRAARGERGEAEVRGTSFAAPQVTARLAALLPPQPEPRAARHALERLAAEASDLGAPGRDPVYGWGLVLPRGRAHGPDEAGPPPWAQH